MQEQDYHMSNLKMNYSNSVQSELNQSFQHILKGAKGKVLIEVAPDNNLKADDIERGDGIVIDTGLTKPHSGGGSYLIRFSDGYKKLCRLMLLPNNFYFMGTDFHKENITLADVEIVGELIGKIGIRKH